MEAIYFTGSLGYFPLLLYLKKEHTQSFKKNLHVLPPLPAFKSCNWQRGSLHVLCCACGIDQRMIRGNMRSSRYKESISHLQQVGTQGLPGIPLLTSGLKVNEDTKETEHQKTHSISNLLLGKALPPPALSWVGPSAFQDCLESLLSAVLVHGWLPALDDWVGYAWAQALTVELQIQSFPLSDEWWLLGILMSPWLFIGFPFPHPLLCLLPWFLVPPPSTPQPSPAPLPPSPPCFYPSCSETERERGIIYCASV